MLQNPIVQRELIGMMRTRKALIIQAALVVLFALYCYYAGRLPIADITGGQCGCSSCFPTVSDRSHFSSATRHFGDPGTQWWYSGLAANSQ